MVHKIWKDFPEVQAGLEQVKTILKKELAPLHPDVKARLIAYIDAPGKYFRAGLCLLLEQLNLGQIRTGKLYMAASIEALHLATLIHDDVIDGAYTRRGITSLQESHSNRIAIYAGDYLFAYSGRLNLRGLEELTNTPKIQRLPIRTEKVMERILAGELAQLMNQFQSTMTFKSYLKQIKGKTALLFALACQTGIWHEDTTEKQMKIAFNMGQALGMAFQLSDDLLDYVAPEKQTGKPRLQDIQNGIYTAPLLLAKRENPVIATLLERQRSQPWSNQDLTVIYQLIQQTSGIENTQVLVQAYIEKSIKQLNQLKRNDLSIKIADLITTTMRRQF